MIDLLSMKESRRGTPKQSGLAPDFFSNFFMMRSGRPLFVSFQIYSYTKWADI